MHGCGEGLHLPEGFISQQKPADGPVREGQTFSPAVDSGQVFTDKASVQVPPQGGCADSSSSGSLQTVCHIICPKPRGLSTSNFKLGRHLRGYQVGLLPGVGILSPPALAQRLPVAGSTWLHEAVPSLIRRLLQLEGLL